jgi:hypothetical protein
MARNDLDDLEKDRSFLARYGATILRGGIAAIPTALFRYQGELELSAPQVWFICSILAHKWDSDLPHPSLSKLAEQTGISRQQLQNHQKQLVASGWLEVIGRQNALGGQDTNYYDFSSLFGALEALLQRDQSLNQGKIPPANSTWHPPAKLTGQAPANSTWHLKEPVEEPVEEPVPIDKSIGQRRVQFEDKDRSVIQRFVDDIARELNDQASLKASTTSVMKLFRQSNLDLDSFLDAMQEARRRTQEASSSIRSKDNNGMWPRKLKFPYFLSVLNNLIKSDDQSTVAD